MRTRVWAVALAAAAVWIMAVAPAHARVAVTWAPYELPKGNVVVWEPTVGCGSAGWGDFMAPWEVDSVTYLGASRFSWDGITPPPGADAADCYLSVTTHPPIATEDTPAYTVSQVIPLSTKAARAIYTVEQGRVSAALSGYVGGSGGSPASGAIVAEFLDSTGRKLGSGLVTAPVTGQEATGSQDPQVWALVPRQASALVPKGTRQIRVVLKMIPNGAPVSTSFESSAAASLFADVKLTLGYKKLHAGEATKVVERLLKWSSDRCDRWKREPPFWRLEAASVAAHYREYDGELHVEVFLEKWPSRGDGDRLAVGTAKWLVKSKEEVVPQGALARYVQHGCPNGTPPGMTPTTLGGR